MAVTSWKACALIDNGAGEELVSIAHRPAGYAQHETSQDAAALDLDASHLIAGKDQAGSTNIFRTRTSELLLFDKMNETNGILLVRFDKDLAVWP